MCTFHIQARLDTCTISHMGIIILHLHIVADCVCPVGAEMWSMPISPFTAIVYRQNFHHFSWGIMHKNKRTIHINSDKNSEYRNDLLIIHFTFFFQLLFPSRE